MACMANMAAASAAEPGHPCASVTGDAARLACYDDAFGRPAANSRTSAAVPIVEAATPGSLTTAAAAAAPAAAETTATQAKTAASAAAVPAGQAEADFGLTEADKRALNPERAEAARPASITSTVASVTRRPTKELVVTLDNGQVWVQAESDTLVRLEAGDVVTIRKASLGSHMLVAPSRAAMRVRRIR